MIEVVNVTKKFGDFTAIQDLNFKVSDGSIYGLIGYNGAGKTTLLKTITGVYKPDGGEVRLDGENAFDNAKMKQHMFYVPDDIYFAPYANMEKMAKFYNGFYPDLTLLSEHLLRICLMNIWKIQMHPLLFLHMTFMNLKGFVTISALSTAKSLCLIRL